MKVRALKDYATKLFREGKFAKCVEVYAQLITLEPDNARLRLRHAEACQRSGMLEQALGSYQYAAKLLFATGQAAHARAALKVALGLSPSSSVLKELLRKMGEPEAPRSRYRISVPPEATDDIDLSVVEASAEGVPAANTDALTARSSPTPRDGADLRRLSSHSIVMRTSPSEPWLVVSAASPLRISAVERGGFEDGTFWEDITGEDITLGDLSQARLPPSPDAIKLLAQVSVRRRNYRRTRAGWPTRQPPNRRRTTR